MTDADSEADRAAIPRDEDDRERWRYDLTPWSASAGRRQRKSPVDCLPVLSAIRGQARRNGRRRRGGLIGARYAWGDESATSDHCDHAHFNVFHIQPMRAFAPNGSGLDAMNGGVREWTSDWYDAEF